MGTKAIIENTVVNLDSIIQITEDLIDNHMSDPEAMNCINRLLNYDDGLFKHSSNVAFLSLLMALSKFKSHQTVFEVFLSALLHDFGKCYIPREILDKPGSLNTMERRIIEQHSVMGYFYLQQCTNLSDRILNGVLEHHEKLNGEGYALNKQGSAINDYAKVIAIADVYDAMVSDRVYHKKFSKEDALNYLWDNRGACFEAELVNIFVNLMLKTQSSDVLRIESDFQTKIIDLCSCIEI